MKDQQFEGLSEMPIAAGSIQKILQSSNAAGVVVESSRINVSSDVLAKLARLKRR